MFLVAYEALHTMDARLKGKREFMAIKLDMSKAYDKVEWDYLEAIMRKISFAERWIHLLMTCVKIVRYSILVNGFPKGILFLLEDLDKVISFHLTSFYCVWKG